MKERMIEALFLSELNTVFSTSVLRRAVEKSGSPEAFFHVKTEELSLLGLRPKAHQLKAFETYKSRAVLLGVLEEAEKAGIRYISEGSEDYPEQLKVLPDRPFGLFVRGRLPNPEKRAVAIVGSRRCSSYGRDSAFFFGEAFALAGLNVISGMAFGVDGYAGRGAAKVPNASFAVLGCGADICYPRENIELYENLRQNGGILTERPPGYYAKTYDFPIRNRIISGLSDVVAVIEAAENSGSLITVRTAIEQNKPVFALPGRITDRMSAGPNHLLREGAEILTCPEDVLQYLGLTVGKDQKRKPKMKITKEEEVVLNALRTGALSTEELLTETGFPLSLLLENLLTLEIKEAIRKERDGTFSSVK